MLPRPAGSFLSSGRKTGISLALHASPGSAGSGASGVTLHDRLSARSRVTNLGVVLLLAFAALSALLNLRLMFASRSNLPPGFASWGTFHGHTPLQLAADAPPARNGTEQLNHLVLVAGHAIWAGCDVNGRDNDQNWILEDYQRGGSVRTFYKHIQRGLQIATADPHALLIFSGGQTRPSSLQTEAESYFSLAVASGLELPVIPGSLSSATVADEKVGNLAHANAAIATKHGLHDARMTTENFALDSFENLLFSIARFREYTGFYPERITVVGYGFKRARFEELHAKAIRWNTKSFVRSGARAFQYEGIDDDSDDLKQQYDGEKVKAYTLFEKDMYGCHGKLKVRLSPPVAPCSTH